MWLATTNHSCLFQSLVVTLNWKLFMTLAPSFISCALHFDAFCNLSISVSLSLCACVLFWRCTILRQLFRNHFARFLTLRHRRRGSVTRFGKISANNRQHFKSLCQLFASLLNIWQNVEPSLEIFQSIFQAHFYTYKWANVEKILQPSGHTGSAVRRVGWLKRKKMKEWFNAKRTNQWIQKYNLQIQITKYRNICRERERHWTSTQKIKI